eukprot:CAMPEP_0182425188 /NCGR_PEP_ID=MMETSP1167-20130531/11537_1 /TAXON_ID=2988 /ORGANISM="Mallomonas Sp, Strain CCMP3275" /LENGTH=568 /DNA_ID=CAMNT_0024605637 /DNA_START=186 /DNA_END=1892 /DNA_ORIENTATION=-
MTPEDFKKRFHEVLTPKSTYSNPMSEEKITKEIRLELANAMSKPINDNILAYSKLNSNETRQLFENFMTKYNKRYSSEEEENEKYEIFRQNLSLIDERNERERRNGGTAIHGVTKFCDISDVDFRTCYRGYVNPLSLPRTHDGVDLSNLNEEVEREMGAVRTSVELNASCTIDIAHLHAHQYLSTSHPPSPPSPSLPLPLPPPPLSLSSTLSYTPLDSLPSITNLGSGDSALYFNLVSPSLSSSVYSQLQQEIQWREVTHKGGRLPRLLCLQGDILTSQSQSSSSSSSSSSLSLSLSPLYRHPTDEFLSLSSWSPTVLLIKQIIESQLQMSFNHVLIQYYRDGTDYISDHSDKTLDITLNTPVVNISFGACRVMKLRSKSDYMESTRECSEMKGGESEIESVQMKEREKQGKQPKDERIIQRISLVHNSMFVLGWQTNRGYTHGIAQDKRRENEKEKEEKAEAGGRISLTFRSISTFIEATTREVYGQGAVRKTLPYSSSPLPFSLPHRPETEKLITKPENDKVAENTVKEQESRLLKAFSEENRSALFDWETWYSRGYDIVDFNSIE